MERKTILFITHAFHNRGGVEEHLKSLVGEISEKAECHVVFPEGGELFHFKDGKEFRRYKALSLEIVAPLHEPQMDGALRTIINEVMPDVIHVMHFLYWPLSLFESVLASEAKKVISFHDYYALTPDFTGMSSRDFGGATSSDYAVQIFTRDISPYLQYRRRFLEAALKQFDVLTVPSKLLERNMEQVFEFSYEEAPYGVHPFEVSKPRKRKNLRFGYLGALIPQKGWESLVEGFRKFRESYEKAELHLFGDGDQKRSENSKNE